ncbi:transmembrane protein 79 [Spea bombifrons]|uniref:transmembrane protein 79 n=1 Tax=Spea bombifrons TaxID=233779 RepID=UPI00234AB6DC|nr:transmembrane protein 79 [Spea bombifrons]
MTQTELVLGDCTKSIVSLGQQNPAKQDDEGTISAMAPQTEDIGTTPDHQKKTRRVGFCDAEAVESPEPKKAEDTKEVNLMDMEGGKEDATSSTTDGAEKPLICRHKTPKTMKCAHVFAMRIPEISSTADCKKTSSPCHACTDCVDNYKNSSKDDKEREKKNEKGDSLPCTDSVSPDSKSSGAKNDSEKSKETDSSEKKDVEGPSENAQVNVSISVTSDPKSCITRTTNAGQEECNEDPTKVSEKSNKEKDGGQSSRNSCEDPDATLCYPDIRKPPECIMRLSDDGLYNNDQKKKSELQSQVKVENDDLQKATPAFFIEHQQLQGPSKGVQKKVQMEMVERVDIEKGEPESKPLIRNHRSMSADEESVYRGQMCCRLERSCVQAVGSFLVSIIVFPPLIYAAYAWLPFDAPVMPDIPTRLVYTLRCGAFASFPIVLGVIIHGISRLCVTSFDPFKPKEREVKIHRHFVKQTTFLFVLYFFNMAVLSTYLPQGYLKLIPLLTCVFALSQLIYWLSFAVGRSFRGFGYGLMFLPLLIMLSCNLCFIFLVDPEKMVPLGTPKEGVKSGP